MSKKGLKTPLRYPGGKSRAVTKMAQYFPDMREYVEFREPFLGGGSVALHMTKMYPHLKITVNDLYESLVPNSIPAAVLILAKYQYQIAFVADQEINMLACLTEIMVECKFK